MEITILAAAIVVLLVIERLPALRFTPLPVRRPHAGSDFFYLLTSGVALSLIAQRLAIRFAAPQHPFATGLALAGCSLVLFDLGSYLSHRLLHRLAFLWEVHKVHHSSRNLDWLATFRGHLVEHSIRQLLSPVFLIALGMPLTVVGLTAAIHGAWSAFSHANFAPRLRYLDWLLVTPRLHRLHHHVDSCEKNFGVMLSLWDRIAGTLTTAPASGPLGVPDEVDTYPQTWARQLVEPFRRWFGRPIDAPVSAGR